MTETDGVGAPKPPTTQQPDVAVIEKPTEPSTKPIAEKQENTRETLAIFLTTILLFEILFALLATWLPHVLGSENVSLDTVKELMTIVFGPTVALVGSAAGFYFGSRSRKSD